MYIRKFTDAEKQFIITNYVENRWTVLKISRFLKAGVATVRKVLHNEGVIRPVGTSNRKYISNFKFFDCIDNELKAYWLGALYADGCVSVKTPLVRFSSIDKDWIENYRKDLECKCPINIEHHKKFNKDIYKVSIANKQIVKSLINNGCIERKSLIIKFPDLDKSLIPHFIRGYFDGDGCVHVGKYITGKNYLTLKVSICSGSKEFLNSLVQFLPVKCKLVRERKRNRIHPLYEIVLSVNDSKFFYNYIYSNATRFLQRKKDKFDIFFQERGSTTIISPSYNL